MLGRYNNFKLRLRIIFNVPKQVGRENTINNNKSCSPDGFIVSPLLLSATMSLMYTSGENNTNQSINKNYMG